ncbi:PIG-L family deacetylase [Aeromicrobium alkaliterrae]|uniref:PIG-L family deacetylase n=1 Tax=Aeromicrobium alkaliterrae TaxID=302168 RepID=A0ABN2K6R7_9ACTN
MPEDWRTTLTTLPLFPADDPGGRVLVLSAHPDDEVLAVGGWLAGQVDRPVTFVTATDGEASHPDSTAISAEELRARRPGELQDALARLGFEDPTIYRLGLPDGGLTAARDELRALLQPMVGAADLVLAPFEADGHPDHDALGEVAVELCADGPTLWRFPIWTWVWTRPDAQEWLPSARRLAFGADAERRKCAALAAFATQVSPVGDAAADAAIVEEALLRHAIEAPEVVIA